jgi:hypothetical protein
MGIVVDTLTAERIAKNDSIFRDANESIRRAVGELGVEGQQVPFICECADPGCTRVALLDLDVYERIRSNPRWFMNVTGHEESEDAVGEIVESRNGYAIVEKRGRAGEVAEELA